MTDEILSADTFVKIREKLWEKNNLSADDNKGKSYPGPGERQSKRLKEKKDVTDDEPSKAKTSTVKPLKPSVAKNKKGKTKCDLLNSKETLQKIADQKVAIEQVCFSCNAFGYI